MNQQRFNLIKTMLSVHVVKKSRDLLLNIPKQTLLILICIIIGISAGISAFLLKSTLHYIHQFIQYFSESNIYNILIVLLPIIGILLTTLYVQIVHKKGLQKGINPILNSIAKRSSHIGIDHTYGHIFSSAITIGFGGSAGFEAPIVATGSAIGSNIAHYFKFNKEDKSLLLASGAAAGISAIFNAPIAGVLFAIEVLLAGIPVAAFIPILLSSATGAIVSKILFSDKLFVLITNEWELKAIPLYAVLGIISGIYSIFIIRQSSRIRYFFDKFEGKWKKAAVGGILLSALIFIFPPLYGEGYFLIQSIFNKNYFTVVNPTFLNQANWTYLYILMLLILKIFASGITISSGGNGGIFAPSLFMGGVLGYFVSDILNQLEYFELNVINFTVAGMAGVLSGVIRIPLTAVFLIAEITGGYALFVPLMIVSASAFFISSYVEKNSFYLQESESAKNKKIS